MSEQLPDLTLADATAIVESLSVEGTEWRQWGKRSDSERLAIGIVILQKSMRGKSLRAIEAELGIPLSTCQRYKERALMSLVMPTVEEARREELERLDIIITAIWPQVEAGDKDAINSYMKVSERKAKMLGLDKPILIDQVVTEVTAQEMELRQLLAQAERDAILEEATIVEQSAIES